MTQEKKSFTSSVHHGHTPGRSPLLWDRLADRRAAGNPWEAAGDRRDGRLRRGRAAAAAGSRGGRAPRSARAGRAAAAGSRPWGVAAASGIGLGRRSSRGAGCALCIRTAARRGVGCSLAEAGRGGRSRQKAAHYTGDGRANANGRADG